MHGMHLPVMHYKNRWGVTPCPNQKKGEAAWGIK